MKCLTTKHATKSQMIAQFLAPFDTGNLRYNAIYIVFFPNGYDIVYDDRMAHYIDYLEIPGVGKSSKHNQFIEIVTFNAIVYYLESELLGSRRSAFSNTSNLEEALYKGYVGTDPDIREATRMESVSRYEVKTWYT